LLIIDGGDDAGFQEKHLKNRGVLARGWDINQPVPVGGMVLEMMFVDPFFVP
jgi:hypothetical protein